jgi:hypothetical protein
MATETMWRPARGALARVPQHGKAGGVLIGYQEPCLLSQKRTNRIKAIPGNQCPLNVLEGNHKGFLEL